MSEHTLDDLAALERELTALGAIVLSAKRGQWIEFYVDGTITAYADRTISGEGPKLGGKLMSVSRAIRQWQASAEPAPPVVPITCAICSQPITNSFFTQHGRSFHPDCFDRAHPNDPMGWNNDAALRGADLAPEGAGDGQ